MSSSIELNVPDVGELDEIVNAMREWQTDGLPVQLHPGDLGWNWQHGPEALAAVLRTWRHNGAVLAVGLLDSPQLIRMAIAPGYEDDATLAHQLLGDLHPDRGVLPRGEVRVEARFGETLRSLLREVGWVPDEPWTPLQRDLTAPVEDAISALPTGRRPTRSYVPSEPGPVRVGRSLISPSTPTSSNWRISPGSLIVHTCTAMPASWAVSTNRSSTTRDVAVDRGHLEGADRRDARHALEHREVERRGLARRGRRRDLGGEGTEALHRRSWNEPTMTESQSIQSAQFVREQLLVRLDVGFGALQVQVQQHAGESFDDLFERHDAEVTILAAPFPARGTPRGVVAGRHGLAGDPPVGVVHLAQLGQREVGRSRRDGSSCDRPSRRGRRRCDDPTSRGRRVRSRSPPRRARARCAASVEDGPSYEPPWCAKAITRRSSQGLLTSVASPSG